MFHIEIEGIEDLERDFRRVENAISDGARDAALHGAREGIAEAKANHRYQDHTPGKGLTDSAFAQLEVSAPGGAEAVMVWPVKYASFIENGTPPHMIVGNPFLSFMWKGVRVHFRYVNHPGTKPYGFAATAYLKAERVIYRDLELTIERGQRILDAA